MLYLVKEGSSPIDICRGYCTFLVAALPDYSDLALTDLQLYDCFQSSNKRSEEGQPS